MEDQGASALNDTCPSSIGARSTLVVTLYSTITRLMFFPDEEGIGENECDEVFGLSDPYSISRQRGVSDTPRSTCFCTCSTYPRYIIAGSGTETYTRWIGKGGGAFVSDRCLEAVSSFSLCPSTTQFVCD